MQLGYVSVSRFEVGNGCQKEMSVALCDELLMSCLGNVCSNAR